VGFGLINYRWVFSAGRFLQSSFASGTSNPQLGGPLIRTFQLPQTGVPHVWNNASEPQQQKVALWARNGWEFCRKWRLPRHFWVLVHAVNLRHGTDGFTSPPKKGVMRIFFARKIRRLRPGLNPRTWVPKASTLSSRPPEPLVTHYAVHSFKSCWLICCILTSKTINLWLYTCNYKYCTLSPLAVYLWVSARLMGGLSRSVCIHTQVDFFFGAV
jgi:hypothetical protein